MRKLLVVAILAVAGAIALLLASMATEGRAERESVDLERARAERARAAEESETDVERSSAPEGSAGEGGSERTPRKRRLLYDDGTPAAGIKLYCASGRRLETRIFRNGDYPSKTVWMITENRSVATDSEGRFTVSPAAGATDVVLYTDLESPAVLLQAFDVALTEYRAARRAKVTGMLRDPDGTVGEYVWLSAELGRPEGYDTRNHQEEPSFVAATGGLPIDPSCKCEAETDAEGRFTLMLAPGRNTLCFGDSGKEGSFPIEIPASGALDLGEIVRPPESSALRSETPRTLHGTVTSLSGQPVDDAVVRLWDGNVGDASHTVRTDETGAWQVKGLHGHRVIAWALSADDPHMVLPQQSSGTILMPRNTPVALVAPGPDEYAWARVADTRGFFLFEREGVLLGGELLASGGTLGLPLGRYRIFAVTRQGVLELAADFRAGGPQELTGFR